MSTEITPEYKALFMADKLTYDSLSQAIRIGKANDHDDKTLRPLMLLKQQYKKQCASNSAKLLKQMSLSQNLLQLEGNWYAIRYVNDKHDTCLKVDIILESHLLQRDGRHERELSRVDLDTLLPAMIDEESLELYKQHLVKQAHDILRHHNIETWSATEEEPVADEDKPVMCSAHAGLRWVQRIMGIKNETQAEEYRRKNYKEVQEAVLSGYASAEKVWEDDDGITYWFDADNILYVRGMQSGVPNIITLYEEDFGFSKPINRMITLEQLAVLRGVKEDLMQLEGDAKEISARVNADVQGINDEISVLESQIALLVSQRQSLLAERDLGNKKTKATKDKYVAEFNKLFKKWDT
jgi:hypothetical protein